MSQQVREIANQLSNYLGVSSSETFSTGFAREVRRIDPSDNNADIASELANAVYIEVADSDLTEINESELLRALWRVSKRWQRDARRRRQLEGDHPNPGAHKIGASPQAHEAVEEVFACLNDLPLEAYTLLIGIMDGMSVADSAGQAGVPRATAYRWLNQIRFRLQAAG